MEQCCSRGEEEGQRSFTQTSTRCYASGGAHLKVRSPSVTFAKDRTKSKEQTDAEQAQDDRVQALIAGTTAEASAGPADKEEDAETSAPRRQR